MTTKPNIQADTISCDVCLKEIPSTVNQNAEADEYVSNFCGLECYQQWRENDEDTDKDSDKNADKASAP